MWRLPGDLFGMAELAWSLDGRALAMAGMEVKWGLQSRKEPPLVEEGIWVISRFHDEQTR